MGLEWWIVFEVLKSGMIGLDMAMTLNGEGPPKCLVDTNKSPTK